MVSAAGQLLGYMIQLPRALIHLLNSKEGDSVCIEVVGDVARKLASGAIISEEDKSSISSNPLTNRSSDVWKTFYNWITDIKNGQLDLANTQYILYCNYKSTTGLIHKYSLCDTVQKVTEAILETKKELIDIQSDHEIWKYYDFVINNNLDIFSKLLLNFELQIGDGAGYEQVKKEIKYKMVPDSQIEFVLHQISGWLQQAIMEKIAKKESVVITWDEFYKKFIFIFERSRRRELLDFTLENPPSLDVLNDQKKVRPNYVKQLEVLMLDDDDILEAVSDYLRADINRLNWIEAERINEDIAIEFEEQLKKFWKNQKDRIDITEKSLDSIEKGKLLLLDCKSRLIPINDMTPPSSTIPGTYHALSNRDILRWHPDWRTMISKNKESK